MGLLPRSHAMLVVLIWIFWLPKRSAELVDSSIRDHRALDALLQDYAFRAFVRPRTGIVYDGVVPSNLTGISISAMRLRRGSLKTRGVKAYKEFEIPVGVVVQPYVKRLVLVYQNLGNWSTVYYPLANYVYLAPVLGLLAYNASDLSAKNLPELDIRASGQPISLKFSDVKSVPDGSVAKCVWFDLHGLVNFSNVVSGNVCSTFEQGHFSIVVESTAPSPAPVSPAPPGEVPNEGPTTRGGGKKKNTTVWIVVGSVVGGLALLVFLGVLAVWVQGYKHRKKMQQMEKAAEVGEALHMTSVGNTKAPSATVTRTQPTLESEYVP
ncbi:transmembrane protein, putative [Actinidia rufa]|uniref:Transmembrane protein, putative n=1 Tax=Actinidia rufa TaxID=165716 RepID=A0A7J0ECH9_9ERIC|nr:transmembrane protein, putative [Actinidia rufa]